MGLTTHHHQQPRRSIERTTRRPTAQPLSVHVLCGEQGGPEPDPSPPGPSSLALGDPSPLGARWGPGPPLPGPARDVKRKCPILAAQA